MEVKEKKERLIKKWSIFIDDISDKKIEKSRFAKIFENTFLKNNTAEIKLIVSICYTILLHNPKIKSSNSKKNKTHIIDFSYHDVYDMDSIVPDYFDVLKKRIIAAVDEKEIASINYLQLEVNGATYSLYVVA